MIDWIDRLPDSMTGALLAGAIWFGFNYAVLAPRAAERDGATAAIPRCMEATVDQERSASLKPTGLGKLLGIPLADQIEAEIIARAMPRPMSSAEKQQRCVCAARAAARNIRFDYALHTASFRLVEPYSVSGMGAATIGNLSSGVCGVLHNRQRG